MNYNRGAYNLGAYNRGATITNIKPLPTRGASTFSTVNAKIVLHLSGTVSGTSHFEGVLKISQKLKGLVSGKSDLHHAKLIVVVSLDALPVQGLSSLSSAKLKLYAVESISLPGLALNPGETLEINTDKITTMVNGLNAIKYWKTGSSPITLSSNGVLTYYDGQTSRTAQMTIIYSDRWL